MPWIFYGIGALLPTTYFIELARDWPKQQEWALDWVERIGTLYHLNERRLELREDSEGFEQRDGDLRLGVVRDRESQVVEQRNQHQPRNSRHHGGHRENAGEEIDPAGHPRVGAVR